MLQTGRYKFVVNEADLNELYDLDEDPHELDNKIIDPECGDISVALSARLRDRVETTDDELPDQVRTKISRIEDVWDLE